MFEGLIKDLKECGRLRNITVHADWDSTDVEGYTYLGIKITNNGISQEYIQFDLGVVGKYPSIDFQYEI